MPALFVPLDPLPVTAGAPDPVSAAPTAAAPIAPPFRVAATEWARGPWDRGTLHGGPVAALVGVARSPMSDEAFRHLVYSSIRGADDPSPAGEVDEEDWSRFAPRLSYVQGDLGDAATYAALRPWLPWGGLVFLGAGIALCAVAVFQPRRFQSRIQVVMPFIT